MLLLPYEITWSHFCMDYDCWKHYKLIWILNV
jgi:hypothetical protein